MVTAVDVRRLAIAALAAIALAVGGAASARAQSSDPMVLVNGQLLALHHGYAVLTTGDALRLAPELRMSGLAPQPGRFVLLHVDRARALVARLEVALVPFRTGIAAASLPREFVVADPRSARAAAAAAGAASGALVPVTIVVEVPVNTPSGDAVYFSSDRSNWSVSETRMDQVDGLHWSLVLPVPDGTTVHYKFTRGSYASIERDRAGADVPARAFTAHTGLKTADVVLRWADRR